MRPLPLLLALFPLAAGSALAVDTLVLHDGRRLQVDGWWESGTQIMYEKYGGTIGIPRRNVVEVLEGDDGSDRRTAPRRSRSYAPAAPVAPAPAPGGREAGVDGLPFEVLWDREERPDAPEEELGRLEERLASHPDQREALSRRLATLLTLRGNDELRAGDADAALGSYRRAVGLDPELGAARINLAVALLTQGRNGEALSHLDRVLRDDPDQSDALFLRGEALYRDERVQEAIRVWERAEGLAPSERTRARLEKARREEEVGGDYHTSAAAHFLLRYDDRRADRRLGDEILDFLEGHFDRMVSGYNVLPESVIVVILYPTEEFHHVTQTSAWTAGLFDGKIRVPIGRARSLNQQMRRTLVHELTHSFVFAKTRGNCPTWLQEGLAQHEEGRRASATVLSRLARDYRSRAAGWGTDIDYDSALALTQFLIGRYGFRSLLDVLDRLRDGATDVEAFYRTFGVSIDDLLRTWGESLVRENAS